MNATTKRHLTTIFGTRMRGNRPCTIARPGRRSVPGRLAVASYNATDLRVWYAIPGRLAQGIHARIDLRKADAMATLAEAGVQLND